MDTSYSFLSASCFSLQIMNLCRGDSFTRLMLINETYHFTFDPQVAQIESPIDFITATFRVTFKALN